MFAVITSLFLCLLELNLCGPQEPLKMKGLNAREGIVWEKPLPNGCIQFSLFLCFQGLRHYGGTWRLYVSGTQGVGYSNGKR